jgi:ribonuclease P/MRP protein subunit POP5
MRFAFADGAGRLIVRTRRESVDVSRAGLAAMDAVEAAPVAVCVRGISGTVRACEEKYLNGRQLPIEESTVAFEDADRPATVRGNRVDVHLGDAFAGAMDLDLT